MTRRLPPQIFKWRQHSLTQKNLNIKGRLMAVIENVLQAFFFVVFAWDGLYFTAPLYKRRSWRWNLKLKARWETTRATFVHLQDSLHNYGKSDHALIPQCGLLREADLQVGKKKLRRGDGVIEDNKVRTEAVAAAELCQHQVYFVHARKRDRDTEWGKVWYWLSVMTPWPLSA